MQGHARLAVGDLAGVPYPAIAERFERLEETLRICLQMWDPDDNGPFAGTRYRLAETLCVPAPVSSPRPEIMIGGDGERKTLRLVAQYADVCNLFASTPEEVGHKLDVLRGHWDSVGRPYEDITKTLLYMGDALEENDVDAFVRDIEGYAKFGIESLMLGPRTGEPATWIERFVAPVVRRAAELG